MSDYTPADYQAMTGGGNWGANGFLEVLPWLFLFGLGGNGFGFGNRGNCGCGNGCATTEEVAAGFNFSGVNGKLNEIIAGQAANNTNLSGAICQLGYQGLEHQAALSAQVADCCCTTQRAVDSAKFDMANYAAATNLAIVENTQKVLDKMCAQENAALQARVTQLENERVIAAATAGIPRINTDAWGVRMYPTCVPYQCNPCCTASM